MARIYFIAWPRKFIFDFCPINLITKMRLPLNKCKVFIFERHLSCVVAHNEHRVNKTYNEVLTEYLQCSPHDADCLLKRNEKLGKCDLSNLAKVASICKDNFKLSDVYEHPSILSLSPCTLKERIFTLQEISCRKINARHIVWFHQILRHTPRSLHEHNVIQQLSNLFVGIINKLDWPLDVKLRVRSRVRTALARSFSVTEIKAFVNCEYMAWKLQCSIEKAGKLQKTYVELKTYSLTHLQRTFEVFLKFNISIKKLCRFPHLLLLDCDNMEKLFFLVPEICGVSIQHIANNFTKILKKPASSVAEISTVLKEFGVTKAQLLSCIKVLDMDASIVLERINRISRHEDFYAVKNTPKFLFLILNYNDFYLQTNAAVDLKLLHSSDSFKWEIKPCGKKRILKDICLYLVEVFDTKDISEQNIKALLMDYFKIHNSSSQNAKRIVDYLFEKGINKEQLLNGIGIVLYDYLVVVEYMEKLPNYEQFQPFSEWCDNPNLVHLLVYAIEKEVNFNGDSVYKMSNRNQDEQDIYYVDENFALENEGRDNLYYTSENCNS